MKRRLFNAAAMLALLVAIGGVGWVAHVIYRYATRTVPNMYAAEWVGGMVVTYLEQNGDRWPRSWEELRPVYEQHVAAVGGRPWTFEELQSRATVDWSADPERLRRAAPSGDRPPFRVIYLTDGGDEHWGGFEPNQMVYEHLTRMPAASAPLPTKDSTP